MQYQDGPVRVAHFSRRPGPGLFSMERIFADVRRHLADDVDVAIVVNRYPSKGVLGRLRDSWRARRYRREVNHILGDIHYVASFLPRKGTLITVHDCVLLETRHGLRRWLIWLIWYWWPLRRAEHVVTVSPFTKKALLHWTSYPSERITVIPPTLGDDFTFVPSRPHGQWREVLMLGGAPNKNIRRVAEALAGLPLRLTLIGTIGEADRASLVQHSIDHVIRGGLDDAAIVGAYRDTDILLFPSTYEGFGMPIIEAQATGRPVITSMIEPMQDTAGGAAVFVDPFDVASIRAGVCRLLDEPEYADAIIAGGLNNAERYRASTVAASYATLYRRLGGRDA